MRSTTRKASWAGRAALIAAMIGAGVVARLLVGTVLERPAGAQQFTKTTVDFELITNRVFFDACISGTQTKVLLDTGYTRTVLSEELVKELELEKLDKTGRSHGLHGSLPQSYYRVDSIALGDFVHRDIVIGCLPGAGDLDPASGVPIGAVVGYDILSQHRITIDYRERRLTFEPHDGEPPTDGHAPQQAKSTTIGFDLRGNKALRIRSSEIILDATINGTPVKLNLDTGADVTILSMQAARRLGVEGKVGGTASGATGSSDISYALVDSLAVGDLTLANRVCRITDLSHRKRDRDIVGDLGGDFLSRHKVTIDYGARQLTFEQYGEEGAADTNLFADPWNRIEIRKPDDSWTFELDPATRLPLQVVLLTKNQGTAEVKVAMHSETDPSLDQFVPRVEQALLGVNAERLSSTREQYAGLECHVVRYKGTTDGVETESMHITFVADPFVCQVNCWAAVSEFDELTDEFEAILNSIRFSEQDDADKEPSPA